MFNTNVWRGGLINRINDTLPGGGGGNIGPQVGLAAGQVGAGFWLDDSNVFYDSSVGTVYGGHFRYVKLSGASSAVALGQIVFEDISVADNLGVVTTLESGSVPGAQFRAGIVLNPAWTAGNYSVIQDVGLVAVKFIATLTNAPAGVGVAVYAAAKGAGSDNGLADTIDTASPASFADVGLLQNRFLGSARELPTNGGTKLVYLNFGIVRD